MISKKVINSEKYKTKVLSSWYKRNLLDYVVTSSEEWRKYEEANKNFKEKLISLLSKYILDEETSKLYEKFPEMFKSSHTIYLDEELLGIDVSIYKIRLPATLTFDYGFPIGDGWRFNITKEELKLFSETELNALKDCAYKVFETSYNAEKLRYREDEKSILSGVDTFGQLYRFDTDLYEYAVKEYIGQECLEFEEINLGDPEPTSSEKRKKVISDNESKNERILEKLKTIIHL